MTPTNRRHRQNRHKIRDMPIPRHNRIRCQTQHHHSHNTNRCEGEREFKPAGDFGHFEEEIGGFDFFGGGAPGDGEGEHVAGEGGGDVEGEAAEEDGEEEGPFEV